jgi:threonine/homoserine/homoserine lactone efflux protein
LPAKELRSFTLRKYQGFVINPKAYAVNMTWFTGFVLFPESLLTETLVKFLVINLIWVPIHLIWLAAGNLVNQLDLSPQTHFRVQKRDAV